MKRFNIPNINTPEYWDKSQTATDFGLRQLKYSKLAGKGETILEVGCGLSPFLEHAIGNFKQAFGLDFSEVTIKEAQRMYPKVIYMKGDANDLSNIDSKFDVVVAGEVIEHLENPDKFIEELKRIGKKVIISTPILEFEDPEHLWEFDEQYFKDKGFKTQTITSSRFYGRKYIFAHI